jgi:hypothetical protein
MRFFVCIAFVFAFQTANCQLVSLFSNKSVLDKDKNSIYDQFNLKVGYANGAYFIQSLKNDSIIFKPGKDVFYETYNNKYLLINIKDTLVIPRYTSNAYFTFPRRLAYIIPIDSLEKLTTIYAVDFKNHIIWNDFDYVYEIPSEYNYFKIINFDFQERKIIICNRDNKKIELEIKELKYSN